MTNRRVGIAVAVGALTLSLALIAVVWFVKTHLQVQGGDRGSGPEGVSPPAAFLGKENFYVRVLLEKPNGIDMRANVLPKQIIDALEKDGKVVRPSRTSANFGYMAFFGNGDFATMEVMNDASLADLSYDKLEGIFRGAPRDGTRWETGDALRIGGRQFSARLLDADDAATGGKQGEIELAVVERGRKVYYYFGTLVEKAESPQRPSGAADASGQRSQAAPSKGTSAAWPSLTCYQPN